MNAPANFDDLARWYRWLEYLAFGRALERCRFALLPELAEARRVLILGEGDGRFLRELVDLNAEARVDVVEASGAMVDLARGRLSEDERGRVCFHRADAREWNFPLEQYDAVVTCFFLDCFNEVTLARLMPRISASVCPDGRWLMAEFVASGNWRSGMWLAALHGFFRGVTGLEAKRLANFGGLLAGLGWEEKRRMEFAGGLMAARVWEAAFFPRERVNCGLNSLATMVAGA